MTIVTTPPNERRVDTPNGRVFVRQIPGEDPPIVLMHGFPDDHRIYDKLLPRLSPRRAVAFDFLGYGRSDRPDAPAGFAPDEHGSELTAVLDELDIDRAVLVGHDASGPDGVFYTVGHPDRVAHLVLLNTVFGHHSSLVLPEMTRLFAEPELTSLAGDMINDPDQRLWLLQRWGVQWELDSDPDGIAMGSILPQFFGDANQPEALGAIRAWTAGWFDSLDKQDAPIDSGALRRLEVPVSIIFGERDRYLNPSLAAELAELFQDPSLQLVKGAGHYPQRDQPNVVADLLKR